MGERIPFVFENAEPLIFLKPVSSLIPARDLQKKDGQWSRAKGFDTFCPLGPWIAVAVLIEHISRFMTLEPGDLIATGTPPGVGPLAPGDLVRVEIEGIGVLENPVVRE